MRSTIRSRNIVPLRRVAGSPPSSTLRRVIHPQTPHANVMHVKGGVAQPKPKRVGDRLAVRVVIPVSDEHAFAVVDMPFLARPVEHGRIIVDIKRDGLRELA